MADRKPTYYQVLMVDPCVDDDVLTAVHRRLVQRTNLADIDEDRRTQLLRALNRAYDVLHDRDRRRLYDRLLEASEQDTERVAVEAPAVIPVEQPRAVAAAPRSSAPTGDTHVLDFGRYAGWSLRQVALRDRDYLEWLRRTPGGRQYQNEIAADLGSR
jgi:curved DNA-binding protein CbpA